MDLQETLGHSTGLIRRAPARSYITVDWFGRRMAISEPAYTAIIVVLAIWMAILTVLWGYYGIRCCLGRRDRRRSHNRIPLNNSPAHDESELEVIRRTTFGETDVESNTVIATISTASHCRSGNSSPFSDNYSVRNISSDNMTLDPPAPALTREPALCFLNTSRRPLPSQANNNEIPAGLGLDANDIPLQEKHDDVCGGVWQSAEQNSGRRTSFDGMSVSVSEEGQTQAMVATIV